MWLIALYRGDVQTLLHLHQLLAQSLPRCHSCRACACACVHVVGLVGNCTRQVFCTPVQTRIYMVTGVLDTGVYTCDHNKTSRESVAQLVRARDC